MSELPSQARVVIIGGGVVGVSCAYHLNYTVTLVTKLIIQ